MHTPVHMLYTHLENVVCGTDLSLGSIAVLGLDSILIPKSLVLVSIHSGLRRNMHTDVLQGHRSHREREIWKEALRCSPEVSC